MKFIILPLLCSLAATWVDADTVPNPGFEDGSLDGWLVASPDGGGFGNNPLSNGFSAPDYVDGAVSDLGSRVAYANTTEARTPVAFTSAVHEDDLSTARVIAAGDEVGCIVTLGNRDGGGATNFRDSATATLGIGYLATSGDLSTFTLLESATVADTTINALDDGSLADFSVTTTIPSGSAAVGRELAVQVEFSTPGGAVVSSRQSVFDNVRVSVSGFTDPDGDSDGDGLTDLEELNLGTDPNLADTDGDLLGDGAEVNRYGTDPLLSDTDGDSNPDGFEIAKGTDPKDPESRTDRPNIIFIFADDLAYGDIGVLFQNGKSGKKHKTPFLDQMAGDGLILDRHYAPAPVCAPSRSSLLTGLHQGHSTVRDNQFDRELEDNHTLATTLKAAGYSTHIIGKWGLQGSGSGPASWTGYPTKRGYDTFFGYVRHEDGHNHYPSTDFGYRDDKELYDQDENISADLALSFTPDLFTARAKKVIEEELDDGDQQPFFLYLAFDTPHAALQIPTVEYPGENPDDDLDRSGLGLNGGVQWLGTPGKMINTATGTVDSYRHPDYTTEVGDSWTDAEERFATLVRRLDDNVGDLRQTLEDLGIADNTLIVLTSDNGPHAETYLTSSDLADGISYAPTSFQSYGPFEGIKRDCWEGGIREPAIVCWPDAIPANTITSQHSQLHDWMPTLCEIAGVPAPARTDGVSLLPTLLNPADPVDQKTPTTYIEYSQSGSTPDYSDFPSHAGTSRNDTQVIFLDNYKGIRANPDSAETDFEIYETLSDPAESTDLFVNPPDGRESYFQELQQRMKDRVLQIRQPLSSAARPWDAAPIPAAGPAVVENGLGYKTFAGLWPWVPEFEDMTPLASGTSDKGPDLAVLPVTDQDGGILFEGFIEIPSEGEWTFSLTSDSGCFLRLHDVMVVDDDFHHDGSTTSGSALLSAGLHPIRLYYVNGADAQPALDFTWSGPGVAAESVPATALFIEGTPDPVPVANPDSASTVVTETRADPVVIAPLDNDIDDGLPESLSIASFTSPANGTVVRNGDLLTYTPPMGFYGEESFFYTVTDGENFVQSTITVACVFDAEDVWLPFNECGGTAILRAIGVNVGSMSSTASRVSGKHGNALSFDGDDSEFSLTGLTGLPAGSTPRTIMAWIRVPAGESPEHAAIFGYGGSGNGERYTFRLNGSAGEENPGTPYQGVRLEVQGGNVIGATPVDDGLWHHVAVVTYDQVEDSQIYVDGVLDSIASFAAEPIDTTDGTVPTLGGSNHDSGYSFFGDVDELRLFPRALSQAEIQEFATADLQASAAWHRRYFGDAALDGWGLDVDGDSVSRLAEYAFGGNPRVSDLQTTQPGFSYNRSTGKLEIAFRRRHAPAANGLSYSVEASRDLSNWDELGVSEVSSTVLSAEDCLEQAVFASDADSSLEPILFSRIVVELNQATTAE
ncbi:MAG: sulfatase-like hydrolase/transferase [Verrucomicrobiales bacterium]|nr:sulfatase-like hydrolase/transferase [Verrucomicrobiota bacterium JB025]